MSDTVTLEENIADLGGVHIALLIYPSVLVGLGFTVALSRLYHGSNQKIELVRKRLHNE